MRARNTEAARLEDDYLNRLRAILSDRSPGTADEIVQGVRDHIEEALAEEDGGLVSLVMMARVIERIGSPEDWAGQGAPAASRSSEAESSPPPPRRPTFPPDERRKAATLLDKIWWASFIGVVGLYIPVIDFYFCSIISSVMLAVLLLRLPRGEMDEFRSAGTLNLVLVPLALVIVPITILQLTAPVWGLLGLPLVLAGFVISLVAYWKTLEGSALLVESSGYNALAQRIRNIRFWGIILTCGMFVLAVVVGLVAVVACGVKHGHELWWLGLLTLPLDWVFGWLFMLRPIGMARDALRTPGVTCRVANPV